MDAEDCSTGAAHNYRYVRVLDLEILEPGVAAQVRTPTDAARETRVARGVDAPGFPC